MEAPLGIKKLSEKVVNRIAAGEIIVRPANALKEIIENSLDAASTNIQITVKNGGLKSIVLADNGTGIRHEDLKIVCERFTTSKLQTFEDLSSISTYGFRGEALASISHVAHLTLQTKTINDKCAYMAKYNDGDLVEGPKLCAGNQGTIITIEDLFYNVPARRQALKQPNEEYQKILAIVTKYAVHNSTICGFTLKKYGEKNSVATAMKSTHIDNIRLLYGNNIAKELIHVQLDREKNSLKFGLDAYITNANYSLPKSHFLLFINHRAVESAALKQAIDEVYAPYLPKGNSPFVYLSLEMNPETVDVNISPTKHEVKFLHSDSIIKKIQQLFEEQLLDGNETRKYYVQQRLPGASNPLTNPTSVDSDEKPIYDKNFVRTDARNQKIDKFFERSFDAPVKTEITNIFLSQNFPASQRTTGSNCSLTSILQLRKSIETKCSTGAREIIENHVFVGQVDHKWAVIQHDLKMYLCDTNQLSVELFYQLLIYRFGSFEKIVFENPLPIKELALLALESPESGWTEEDGDKNSLSDRIVDILCGKADMLLLYFSLDIDFTEKTLKSLPYVLEKHLPSLAGLPMYLLRLATEVEWDIEKSCFESFARETALYYAEVSLTNAPELVHSMETVIYPALKQFLLPEAKFLSNKSILEVAKLSDLYKVFERC